MTSAKKMKEFRAEITQLIPWVRVLKNPRENCTALTSKYWSLGFKTRRDMPDEDKTKYRCLHLGTFRFQPLKHSFSLPGTYCEIHLRSAGIFGSMEEDERYQRWCRKNSAQLNLIRMKYGLQPVPTMKEFTRANHH